MRDLTEGREGHKVNYENAVKDIEEDTKVLKILREVDDYLETCKNKKTKIQVFLPLK